MKKIFIIFTRKISDFLEASCDHCEGGIYIGPEFQLGQVYDGTLGLGDDTGENIVLYRPMYVCVKTNRQIADNVSDNDSKSNNAQKSNGVE